MSQSPFPPKWNPFPENAPIIRDYGKYCLSFPCNPYDLHHTATGFRLLVLSDFVLVVVTLLLFGTAFWLINYSPEFQNFIQNITPERLEAIQKLTPTEQHKLLQDELPIKQLMPISSLISILTLGGLLANFIGTIMATRCPNSVIPKCSNYALIWFGAFLLAGFIPSLGPLMLLLAWQYWLSYIRRLAFLLGDSVALQSWKKVNRYIFYTILAILLTTLMPLFFSEGASSSYVVMSFTLLFYFIATFYHYATTLKQLRLTIDQLKQYWDNGNEEMLKNAEKTASTLN
ncbi:MAG: hypothetical protein Q4C70_07445 [Planctomycetia bacterium]|nr:hypothetical protein [Planctomycetia bacterium]